MPERIQLKRTKGWKMPADAVKVDRTTKWGNPFTIADVRESGVFGSMTMLRGICVSKFRAALSHNLPFSIEDAQRELRGKDLCCWCPLPEPGEPDICHAAVLLEIANR
jgi:hypothetical protein